MHMGKTHYVIAVTVFEGKRTFIKAWWSPGAHLYMFQNIDVIDEKTMGFGPVNVDPMYGNDLSVVIRECYQDYEILEYSVDYTG